MNAMAALKQYQTVNTQAQVFDASPHRLIQMLMEGGLSRLAQAKGAMERGQVALKGELLGKAIAIIGGLREGLDLRQGGELAANRHQLVVHGPGHRIACLGTVEKHPGHAGLDAQGDLA